MTVSMLEPIDIFVSIDDERAVKEEIFEKDKSVVKDEPKLINKKKIYKE